MSMNTGSYKRRPTKNDKIEEMKNSTRTNTDYFKFAMTKSGYTVDQLATKMCCSTNSLYLKLRNIHYFNQYEIKYLKTLFRLTDQEVNIIFFN